MTEVRAVIVDDEPLAREKLRALAVADGRVRLIGEAEGGVEAVDVIERLCPELVFLDVQMPGLDGFAVLEALRVEPLPRVVFVTAHDEHAVRAFRVRALDYLLKPVDPERFAEALDRLLDAPASGNDPRHALDELPPARRRLDRFLVRTRGRMFLLATGDVDWIAAAGNYVKLHVAECSHLVRGTLRELEERLPPERFVRIHRSTIVNLDRIESLEPWFRGDWIVTLKSGVRLTLSRRYRHRLHTVLGP